MIVSLLSANNVDRSRLRMLRGLFYRLCKQPHEIGSLKILILQMGRQLCIRKKVGAVIWI